ncbi:MAG: hypothetical protein ACM31C_06595 [Acidobacteriota bacterium]
MRTVAAIVALAACGSSAPPGPVADVSGAEPTFAPGSATMSDLVGISYQLPADATLRAFAVAQLAQAGIRHARADVTWSISEPARGARDFTWFHAEADAYAGAGVEVLPIIDYGNPWANQAPHDNDRYPPDHLADFAAYAGATAHELGFPAYEVWNEENVGFDFWRPREQPDQYGTLLADAAAQIRSAQPGARVVFGGLFGLAEVNLDAETFLQLAYRAHGGLGKAYDVLAVHPYPIYPPHSPPELDDDATGEIAEPRTIAQLRAALAYWGDDPAREIWVTEIGWPTYQNVDEERQARWLVRSALVLAGAGVTRVYFYSLIDDPSVVPPEDSFGLFRAGDPPVPKLAWTAVTTLLARCGELAVTDDVTAQLAGAPADAHAYALTGGSSRVVVVWRTNDDAPATTVTMPFTPAAVIDMDGTALATTASVPLSGRPVYVIEN